jgi:hypothetical protein
MAGEIRLHEREKWKGESEKRMGPGEGGRRKDQKDKNNIFYPVLSS